MEITKNDTEILEHDIYDELETTQLIAKLEKGETITIFINGSLVKTLTAKYDINHVSVDFQCKTLKEESPENS